MTLNKALAFTAIILALFAALIGVPKRGDRVLSETARLIDAEGDHITPVELAEQIRSGRQIRLIDLRDSASFEQQHIVHAELMTVQQLLENGLNRNEYAVLYSEGGIHASQAWILLRMKHFDSVYTLLGGFTGWKEEILSPKLAAGATEAEKQEVELRKMLSMFFGGEPAVTPRDTTKNIRAVQNQSPTRQHPQSKAKKEEEKLRREC
jgi:rhodanese-related sulfurtransferase